MSEDNIEQLEKSRDFYPPFETEEQAQGNDTLIQYYEWRPPGWSSIVNARESVTDSAGNIWDSTTDVVNDWHPGQLAGEASRGLENTTGWHPGEYAGKTWRGAKDFVGGVVGGIGNMFGETAKTVSFMMWVPIILTGTVLFVIAIFIVAKIAKGPTKKK